ERPDALFQRLALKREREFRSGGMGGPGDAPRDRTVVRHAEHDPAHAAHDARGHAGGKGLIHQGLARLDGGRWAVPGGHPLTSPGAQGKNEPFVNRHKMCESAHTCAWNPGAFTLDCSAALTSVGFTQTLGV